MALPYRAHGEASYLIKLQILKRFEFTSQAMKSGTIAVAENESDDTAVLFVKGAPSVIQQIADPVTVPPDFTKVSMMPLLLHAWPKLHGDASESALRRSAMYFAWLCISTHEKPVSKKITKTVWHKNTCDADLA